MPQNSEVLMRLVNSSGTAISASCVAQLNPPDDLMTGFQAGCFFAIDAFKFGVGLSDDGGEAPKGAAKGLSFSRWRAAAPGQAPVRYSLDVEPISFDRVLDHATTSLFSACCQSQTFQSAAIVRRMETPSGPKAFVRLDFTDVLITTLAWEEGDTIKERCEFLCRAARIQYLPQNSDGSLGAPIPGVWPKS